MSSSVLLRSAVVATLLGAATPAVAQSRQEGAITQLETVVVTASKREQPLQEVPIAVSTIDSEELAQRNVSQFSDYLPSVPGVQYIEAGSQFQKSISIRGVSDGSGSALTQTPVSLYLDETPLTLSQGAFNVDYLMYGIDRVSVIKGPHSTLYGAASLGGTIKVETVKPSLTELRFGGRAGVYSVEDGGTGYTVAGTVSGPLVENRFGMELTGYVNDRAGYIDDPSRNAEDINGGRTTGGRLAARWVPSDQLTIDATVYVQDDEIDSVGFYTTSFGDLTSRPLLFDQRSTDDFTLASLVLRYDFGGMELVSATGYVDREGAITQDYSSSFFNLGIPGSVVTTSIDASAEVWTQELRLASTGDSRFNWLVGAFYSKEDYTEIAAFTHSILGALFDGPLLYEYETMAAFGEMEFGLTDALSLTVGGRYTDYTAGADFALTGLFAPPNSRLDREDGETDFSPRAALSYDYGGGSVYVQAAKGFRLGQANVPIVALPTDDVPAFFRSDSLWNYELGAKTSWLDRRLELNAAVYYIDWEDIQSTLVAGTGLTYIANAGSAEIRGAELEVRAVPRAGMFWTAGVSYNDGELAENVPTVAPKGTRLPGVPEFTFSTALQQDFQLAGRNAFVRADYLHYGEYDNAFPSALGGSVKNGDYDRVDLRFGMSFGGADFVVYANNVTDERPILFRQSAVGVEEVATIQPRTYGVAVNFQF